jgi:hypothetical protein
VVIPYTLRRRPVTTPGTALDRPTVSRAGVATSTAAGGFQLCQGRVQRPGRHGRPCAEQRAQPFPEFLSVQVLVL